MKELMRAIVAIENLVDRYLTSQTQFRVFIEKLPADDNLADNLLPPSPPEANVLIFVKHFDPEKQLIR